MIRLPEHRLNLLISLCLLVVVAAVYAPVRHYAFINYDDPDYVYQNPQVQSGLTLRGLVWAFRTNHAANWHPLTWISHMLDCQLFGLHAGAHHLVSLLFHMASTLLLFRVLQRVTASPWRSAFVAAVFALHPLHVESVAWVAERKDVLSTFFWMLTVWAYVRYVETVNTSPGSTRNRFYVRTIVFFALGLMAKPMVVTLPFLLLLLDYWPLGRTQWAKPAVGEKAERPWSSLLFEKLPFFALSAASCVVTFWAQRSGRAVASMEILAFGDRLANAVVSYMWYIGKMFWPTGLAVLYPYHAWSLKAALWAGAVLLVISGLVACCARRKPYLAVGWLWYVGTLVPMIGLVQVGAQSAADRYTYLPLTGLFIMLAWSLPRSVIEKTIPRWVAAIVAVTVVSVCAVACRAQIGYWKDSEALFRHELAVTGVNWTALNNLALALVEAGKPQEALEYFEQALRLRPDYAESHYNLGLALASQGRLPEAIEEWKEAVRINPDYAEAQFNLGIALQQTGKPEESIRYFEEAARIKPDFAEAYYNLGNALMSLGKPEESVAYYQQALRLKPDYAAAHYGIAVLLAGAGKTRDAIGHYEWAMAIQPDFVAARDKLALLLATLPPGEGGDPIRALNLAEKACALTGNQVPAYLDTLAVAYAAAGRFDDAVATAQKAAELARAAGQLQLLRQIETHLQLYRNRRTNRGESP